jgi:hypothetical protein
MKPILALICILLGVAPAFAIKPEKAYRYTPEQFSLEYEELKIDTSDGATLNVWHLPSEETGIPVIISQSDAGNMGYWLYMGAYFQACGLDVWLYDYRGFGESSEFEIDRDCLFHNEFVEDLAAVAGYVYKKTSAAPVLLGLSMGTIIINEYLKDTDIPVTHVIYDGYAGDPAEWVNKLKANGKDVKLPESKRQRALYIVGLKDGYASAGDIPFRKSKKTTVKTFDSGHISSFNQYPEEYTVEILNFLIDK